MVIPESPDKNISNDNDPNKNKANTHPKPDSIQDNAKKQKILKKKTLSKQKSGPPQQVSTRAIPGPSRLMRPPPGLSLVAVPYAPTYPVINPAPTYYPQYSCNEGYCCPPPYITAIPIPPNRHHNIPLPPVPVPVALYNSQPVMTGVYPYPNALVPIAPRMPDVVLPVVTNIVETPVRYNPICELPPNYRPNDHIVTIEHEANQVEGIHIQEIQTDSAPEENATYAEEIPSQNQLDYYMSCPRELFPTARMVQVNPDPLIDEICRLPNIHEHLPWMLDLEFGIPRSPVTRPIAAYDVQCNTIRCKNAPQATHPAFESCNPNFKKVFLFYYDCIVSTWYKSYMSWTCDSSVANFELWVQRPMQDLGLCWP